jgi:hypothetical protein
MRNVLVIFYSYTGTSRRVATLLASQQGWVTGEILDTRRRAGASGIWNCVLDSLLRRTPQINYEGPDPLGFEAVVLVSPVWLNRPCGPMRSFVAANACGLRSYAVVFTMASSGADDAEAELANLAGRPPLLSLGVHARHVEDGSFTTALDAFGDVLAGRETYASREAELWAHAS